MTPDLIRTFAQLVQRMAIQLQRFLLRDQFSGQYFIGETLQIFYHKTTSFFNAGILVPAESNFLYNRDQPFPKYSSKNAQGNIPGDCKDKAV